MKLMRDRNLGYLLAAAVIAAGIWWWKGKNTTATTTSGGTAPAPSPCTKCMAAGNLLGSCNSACGGTGGVLV